LPSGAGQISYMVAYVGIRSFIPATLLDFVFRFTSSRPSRNQQWLRVILYGTAAIFSLHSMITGSGLL